MKKLLKQFGSIAVTLGLLLGLGGGTTYVAMASATQLRVVQTPTIHLYSGISATATSARVTPYPRDLDQVKLTMTDFGSTPTFTIDPKLSGYEEIISFTGITDNGDNTATLTGLSRDLYSKYPYTTAGTGRTHSGGATVVFGNNPQIYGRLAALENDQTFTGTDTFGSTTKPVYDGNPSFGAGDGLAFVNYSTLLATAISGAGTSTEGAMGIVRLASNGQTGIASSTTGAPYVIPNRLSTSTYNPCCAMQGNIVALNGSKVIDPMFISTSTGSNYNFLGTVNIASSTMSTSTVATTTVTGQITYQGKILPTPYFGGTGADGALSVSSGTTTISGPIVNGVIERDYTSISITGTGVLTFSGASTVILKSQGACTITSSKINAIDGTGVTVASGGSVANAYSIYIAAKGQGGAGGGSTSDRGGNGNAVGADGFAYGGIQLAPLASSTSLVLPGGTGAPGNTGAAGGFSGGAPGAGGKPGIGLYMECGGAWNFTTGGIKLLGANGADGTNGTGGQGGGGGGGGGGGNFMSKSASITADSGTYNTTAGTGGAGFATGGGNGVGGSSGADGTHLEVKNTTNY